MPLSKPDPILNLNNATSFLPHIKRGIEKESLRVCPEGKLAQTPHSPTIGSALTHPYITTDFSEALLEFITPAQSSIEQSLSFLTTLHQFTCRRISGEYLWAASMPCIVEGNAQIPIARYGSSHTAQMKEIYRIGLGHRYGRLMQTIAGIHYNFSMPQSFWAHWHSQSQTELSLQDFITDKYFGLIRNFRRMAWLPVYLFGASPAVCNSFLKGHTDHQLTALDKSTSYTPFGTSLRMGDLGYQSNAQEKLKISYNSLTEYAQSLRKALSIKHPAYEAIGVKKDNQWQQLNTSVLQIENEFYNWIRPKQTAKNGERPVKALENRGVEYIEVRCLDLNPWEPLGLGTEQFYFLDSFLLYCLLSPSPAIDDNESQRISENVKRVVNNGRKPGLTLLSETKDIPLSQLSDNIFQQLTPIAALFDHANNHTKASNILRQQQKKVHNPDLTPSAQIIHTLQEQQKPWFTFAMEQSKKFTETFAQSPYHDEALMAELTLLADTSLQAQQKLEQQDTKQSFEDFLQHYFQG